MHIENNSTKRSRRAKRWIALAAAVLVIAILVVLLVPKLRVGAVEVIATPNYPEMAPYPQDADYINEAGEFDSDGYMAAYDLWWASQELQQNQPAGYTEGLDGYFRTTMRQFLAGAGEKNVVYSPLNVYLALAMLAETTDGDSRQQILDLLGAADMETLRTQASALWNANYSDDGVTTSHLASSLWLNEEIAYHQDTLDQLAQTYYASSYQGQMGSSAMDQALQSWLNEQTGGLLEDAVEGVQLDAKTVLALATTIYYRAAWADTFLPENTASGTFNGAAGEQNCDFMHQSDSQDYYWGEKFSAVGKPLRESGNMWFVLPDEGVSPEDLLQDEETMKFMLSGGADWSNSTYVTVNLSVPKFDVSSDIQLQDGLKALGITDVFDGAVSDFSPLCQDPAGIYLSTAQHAARVSIDEEGCTATAFTLMAADRMSMPPEEEVDFTLDRPFLFLITGQDGTILFAGVVNQV